MMKQRITVCDNRVEVTDVATKKRRYIAYCMKYTPDMVVNDFTSFRMGGIGYHGYGERVKQIYKAAGDELGVSVAAFAKQLNGAIYRAYIEPNKELHTRFSLTTMNGKRWYKDPIMVNTVNDNAAVIQGYLNDGTPHTAGFGLLALDAYNAKRLFGKGLWKKLSNNSKSRNDIICKKVRMNTFPNVYPKKALKVDVDMNAVKQTVRFLSDVPSTLLYRATKLNLMDMCFTANRSGMHDLLHRALQEIGGPLYKVDADKLYTYHHTVMDTARMMEQIGETFNPRWSFKRMKREHDRAMVVQVKQKSSVELFPYVDVLPHTLTSGRFTAILCKSHREMAVLGAQEHHCVGSYHNRGYDGEYAVYKITDENDVISTIGITHPKVQHTMDQHYLAYNKTVEDKERVLFAKNLTREIKSIMAAHIRLVPDEPEIIMPPLNPDNGVMLDLGPAVPQVPAGYRYNENGQIVPDVDIPY